MDALDLLLNPPAPRACEDCRHARATAHDGLHCQRGAQAALPCTVERASRAIEAWLYGACGSRGRFFAARTAAVPARLLDGPAGTRRPERGLVARR
jgi:hypothetical protein